MRLLISVSFIFKIYLFLILSTLPINHNLKFSWSCNHIISVKTIKDSSYCLFLLPVFSVWGKNYQKWLRLFSDYMHSFFVKSLQLLYFTKVENLGNWILFLRKLKLWFLSSTIFYYFMENLEYRIFCSPVEPLKVYISQTWTFTVDVFRKLSRI